MVLYNQDLGAGHLGQSSQVLEILQVAWEQTKDHHPCGLQWAQLAGAFSLKAFWEACFQLEAACRIGWALGRREEREVCL